MKKILNVAHHRNGISGNPFHVVTFRDGRQKMIGIVFEEPGSIAVFDSDLLAQDVIAFGENSWRGDDYETFLRAAAKQYDNKLHEAKTQTETVAVMKGGKKIWSKSSVSQRTIPEPELIGG